MPMRMVRRRARDSSPQRFHTERTTLILAFGQFPTKHNHFRVFVWLDSLTSVLGSRSWDHEQFNELTVSLPEELLCPPLERPI